MYVLTRSENQYDQYGDYLETVFKDEPTLAELSHYFYTLKLEQLTDEQLLFLAHVKRGGGRQGIEDTWYHLSELNHGQKYEEK